MPAIYRSESRDFSPGRVYTVPLAFLDPALKLNAPTVEKIFIRFQGHVTPADVTGSGTMPQSMLSMLLDRVLLQDLAGDRVNLTGMSLLLCDQMEGGLASENYGPDLATGGSREVTFIWEIPFTPHKARRRNDFGMSVNEFFPGGKLQLTMAQSATLNGAVVSVDDGQFDVYAQVREDRKPIANSRVVWIDQVVGSVDYVYPINGNARYFLHRVTEEDWISGVTLDNEIGTGELEITSRTIDYSQLPESILRYGYQLESQAAFPDGVAQALGSRTEDLTSAGFALPVISPRFDQKIGEMFAMTGLHYKYASTGGGQQPNGIIVYSAITDRSIDSMTKVLKAPNKGALVAGLKAAGRVKSALTGADTGLGEWDSRLTARLPVTVR